MSSPSDRTDALREDDRTDASSTDDRTDASSTDDRTDASSADERTDASSAYAGDVSNSDTSSDDINLPLVMSVARRERSASLTSPSYYSWRHDIWRTVNRFLSNKQIPQLILFYDSYALHWKQKQRLDMIFITQARKGITLLFNSEARIALKMMKKSIKELESLVELNHVIPNLSFIKADLYTVTALLYIQANKLGKAWMFLNHASKLLESLEICEFHSDWNYTVATFFLRRSMIGAGNNPGLSTKIKIKALSCAQRSRDVLAAESDAGEWFAMYAFESLFLHLRILLEADLFGFRTVLSFDEFKVELVWSRADIEDARKMIQTVTYELSRLKFDYPYAKCGLVKCQCILNLQDAKAKQKHKDIMTAIDLCQRTIEECVRIQEKCRAFTGVMSKFVQQSCEQMRTICQIAQEFKAKLRRELGRSVLL